MRLDGLYPGYWIKDCRKMHYKMNFKTNIRVYQSGVAINRPVTLPDTTTQSF